MGLLVTISPLQPYISQCCNIKRLHILYVSILLSRVNPPRGSDGPPTDRLRVTYGRLYQPVELPDKSSRIHLNTSFYLYLIPASNSASQLYTRKSEPT
jgi:hypothetical protein